jgi:hypothetical protein
MATTIAAHEQPISRVFSNDYVFHIPPFQRPYAWTIEQAGELLSDLIDFMTTRHGDVEEMSPYFLGSIVLIKAESNPSAEVVDGQQRLTTLTLLLSAIRANVGTSNAADITQLIYEKGSQILGTQDRFRLSLRDRDREFFQKYAQREDGLAKLLTLGEPSTDSQRNIRDNARLFNEKLKALPEAERLRLAQFIVTRCYLVVVATPDLNSAYRIFSVLNTRGLDLTATDILKASIVGAISPAQRDVYTKKWEDTEEDLGRSSFGDLFGHIRMVYRKAKPHGTLLEEFKESVTKDMEPQHFIDEVLIPMASVFAYITDRNYTSSQRAEEVNEHLKWLGRLEFSDWIPPALAFAVRHGDNASKMESFVKDLERLAYSMLLTRAGVNERIERFSRLTRSIENDEDLFKGGCVLQLSPNEQHAAYSVLSGPIYELLSARACSVVLLRLDALVSSGGATYDYDTISVEHVLPQTPKAESEWLTWFPDAETRAVTVHCLGNLALLTRKKNSSASNYEFSRKKSAYFTRGGVSPFALTTQIIQQADWTESVVSRRQNQLLSILESYWRLQDREPPSNLARLDLSATERTWREDVHEALCRLGGKATLAKIYEEVRSLREVSGRSISVAFTSTIRRTLEQNSTDSDNYLGGHDLFCMPEGKGSGIWALRATPTGEALLLDNTAQTSTKTATQLLQLDFWTMFKQRLLEREVVSSAQTPRPQNWFDVALGRKGIFLSNIVDTIGGRIGVRLYIKHQIAESALAQLAPDRIAIESEIGQPLVWNPTPEKQDKIISLSRNVDLSNRAAWPEYCDWLVGYVAKFREAFAPRISALKLDTNI